MYIFCVATGVFIAEKTSGADGSGTDCIEMVKNHTKTFVKKIRSIEFEAVAKWDAEYRNVVESLFNPRTINYEEQMKYFQRGNRLMYITKRVFHGKSSVFNGDHSSDWIIICNEERFQIFQLEEKMMEWSEWSGLWADTVPSRGMSPIIQAFSWLAKKDRPYAWSNITAEENIDDIFKQAKYIGNKTFNGIECVVLAFHGTHADIPTLVCEVWFSLENDYFPVKIVSSVKNYTLPEQNKTLESWTVIDMEVKKMHEVIVDNDTNFFIPVEIVSVNTYPRSEFISSIDTIIMDTSTLKINHEIDDSRFVQPITIEKRMPHTGQCTSCYIIVIITTICIVFIGLVVYWLLLSRRWMGKSCNIQRNGEGV